MIAGLTSMERRRLAEPAGNALVGTSQRIFGTGNAQNGSPALAFSMG